MCHKIQPYKTATFHIVGDGGTTLDLKEIHDHVKDTKILGLTLPKPSKGVEGQTVYAADDVFLNITDRSQSTLNLNLPAKTIRDYTSSQNMYFPLMENTSFEYSKLKSGSDIPAGNVVIITVFYEDYTY